MELNERIIQARKQAGLTQEQLGEKLGVSRQAVSKWESGQANPDVTYIIAMCRLFDVSADWLLFGKDSAAADSEPMEAPQGAKTYCLFLNHNDEFSWTVAERVAMLYQYDWAKPTMKCDPNTPISTGVAWSMIQDTPMVMCRGLTYEQAVEGAELFCDYPGMVSVFRDFDLEDDDSDPQAEEVSLPYRPEHRQPLSGGAIFGLVVLGVIVAILLMSIF